MKGEKDSVLVVAEGADEAGAIASRLRAGGWKAQVVSGFKEATDAAGRWAFEMVILCGGEGRPEEAEIVKAARAQNAEVAVVHTPSGGFEKAQVPLDSVLRWASLRGELRQMNKRLEDLLGGIFDGVIAVDTGKEAVAFASKAAAGLLGYEEGEMEGMSIWELIPQGQREKAKGVCEDVLRGRRIEGGNLVLIRKDGEPLPCRFNSAIVGRRSERLVQIVFESVSDRKKLIQQFIELGEAFSLGQAISGIVHEINNPLAAIVGYAQLSVTTTSRKKLDEYLQVIHQQAGRCQAISQKLSSFVWSRRRRDEPHKRVVDLNGIIREVVSLFEHELGSNDIQVNLNVSSSALPVRVDPEEMQQVFVSLLTNATEAMTETTSGMLSVVSQRSGREAVVIVSDNGPGIPEEVRKKIFQPFFTTKPNGTGLGLSISRAILRSCEGDIEFVGKGESGAAFRIRLPLVSDAVSHDSATEAEEEEVHGMGKTILVAEGQKPVANLLRQILKRAGEKADVALTPTQSRRTIKGKDYDVIQVDIEAPGRCLKGTDVRTKERHLRSADKVVFCEGELLDEETRCFLTGLESPATQKPSRVSRVYAISKNVQ